MMSASKFEQKESIMETQQRSRISYLLLMIGILMLLMIRDSDSPEEVREQTFGRVEIQQTGSGDKNEQNNELTHKKYQIHLFKMDATDHEEKT